MENENQKKKIDSDFYYYLSYRETDDKEKLKRLEQWRVEACIDYAVYYNGLIQRVDKFLTVFEMVHREDKRDMYLKRYTKEQVEQVLTDENLGIPLSQYTNGKLSGYYYYNEAKKDKLFFKAALDIREAKDNLIRLIKEIKEKATEERQRLKTTFSQTQLGDLYERLIEDGYIKKETEKKLFVWLFGGDIEPQQYKAIVWTLKNERGRHKGKPAKTALLYMIQGLLGKNPSAEEQRTICKMFVDDQGKGINLPKTKNNEFNFCGTKIQDFIKTL